MFLIWRDVKGCFVYRQYAVSVVLCLGLHCFLVCKESGDVFLEGSGLWSLALTPSCLGYVNLLFVVFSSDPWYFLSGLGFSYWGFVLFVYV